MKRRLLVIAMFFVVLVCRDALIPSNAYACSCAYPATPQDGFEMADAVFTGKVLNITQASQPYPQDRVLLEVLSTWKGDIGREVIVTTTGSSASCGYAFAAGTAYLVYAHSYDDKVSIGIGSSSVDLPLGLPKLGASICSRTNLLTSATQDLAMLGPGNPPAQDGLFTKLKGSLPYMLMASAMAAGILLYRRFRRPSSDQSTHAL